MSKYIMEHLIEKLETKVKNSPSRKVTIVIPKSELLDLVKSGKTDREIAEVFYCSESTIQRIRTEFGIGKYYTIYNREQYLRMKKLKLTDEQVSFILGVSRRALNDWKYKEKLTFGRE